MTVIEYVKDIKYMQYISTIIASLGATCTGTIVGWSSPSVPLLISDHSPIGVQLTPEEASWAASCFSLGMIPGSIVAGSLLNKFGHKYLLIFSSVFFLASWILVAVTKSLSLLLTGRVVGGLGGGVQLAALQLYVGEIADKNIRGKLAVFPTVCSHLGMLISLGIGPFVSFHTFTILCACVALIFGTTVLFIPQSPYFLMKKGDVNSTKRSLSFLSKTIRLKNKIDETFEEVQTTIKYQTRNKFTLSHLLLKKRYRKSLIVVFVLKTLCDFSGGYAVNSYVQIILDSGNSSWSSEVSSLVYAIIQVTSIFFSAFLVDRVGRKPLTIVSAGGASLTLIIEGTYFYLKDVENIDLTGYNFLAVLILCLYRLLTSLALSHIPYVLISELFSVNTKEICSLILSTYTGVLMFTTIKIFNPILEAVGLHSLLWIYASCCILTIVFVIGFMPETKGKSFNAIQDELESEK
ncbi:hypothetical protein FQR65_LT05485 [Abscondita terminalis]|nr:hypothetical protein FQR65_LT05485 [Abscondita terminalis]